MTNDTICAVATGRGGAISVIRVSGPSAVEAVGAIFAARNGKALAVAAGYTVHFGEIVDDEVVDEVVVTAFRAPHSYTGEDSVEISCHASPYIEGRIIGLLLSSGVRLATPGRNADGEPTTSPSQEQSFRVRLATPGEFTARAFLAGKMDLAQAEAVADLIASTDRRSHALAMNQMRGGVSSAIAGLRAELVELAALLELELDFGDEDVEFASRERLAELAGRIASEIDRLVSSFALGNAIRRGVPVAIVGRPNAGKSTLLNALVDDDRAMVSEIAGTTRDRIEERVSLAGVTFRFIDTAGLRATADPLEQMGIERSLAAVREAAIVLLVVDGRNADGEPNYAEQDVADLALRPDQKLCVVINKIDVVGGVEEAAKEARPGAPGEGLTEKIAADEASAVLRISAKTGEGLDGLREWLVGAVDVGYLGAATISTARHIEALTLAREAVGRVLTGLGIPADLLAEDVRETLHHLGTITGAVTTDEILGEIFSKFCIGK